jgi:hypothetical protein
MTPSTATASNDDGEYRKDEKRDLAFHDMDQVPQVDGPRKPDGPVITSKSKGVIGMELLLSRMNLKYYCLLYGGFILLAYTLSLGELYELQPLPSGANARILKQINTLQEHIKPMRHPKHSKLILS